MRFSRSYRARDLLQSQCQRSLGKLLFPQQRCALCPGVSFCLSRSQSIVSTRCGSQYELAARTTSRVVYQNFIHKLLDDSHLGLHSNWLPWNCRSHQSAGWNYETAILPQVTLLQEIIQQILGAHTDKVVIQRCLLSIFGQCLLFKHSRSIIDRLYPELIANESAIQASADISRSFH